jgi:phosphohistidine phosphatase
MNILIVRHGIAERSAASDAERRLTSEGERLVRETATIARRVVPTIGALVSSPLVRAVQTAEIWREAFGLQTPPLVDQTVGPGATSFALTEIADSLNVETVSFFGHQPDVARLVLDFAVVGQVNFPFDPGTVAWISFNGKPRLKGGTLEMLLPGMK